jgi:hypothetical protein
MTSTEVVTGYFRGEGGGIHAMDLPLPEVMHQKLTKGYLQRVNEDGTPYTEPTDTTGGAPAAPQRPAQSASKAEWVGWAVHNGMAPDDADAQTKHDLIEKFGKDIPPSTPPAGSTGQPGEGTAGG